MESRRSTYSVNKLKRFHKLSKSKVKKRITKDIYRLCPECGNFAHLSLGQIYCVNCGAKMIDRCFRCGEPIIYPTARFCPICGEGYLKDKRGER